MLYSYPILGTKPLDPRLIYLRSMIVAMELLKNGVTCLVDDIIELPVQGMDAIDAVFQAYDNIGIRANVSGHVIDRPFVICPLHARISPPGPDRRGLPHQAADSAGLS